MQIDKVSGANFYGNKIILSEGMYKAIELAKKDAAEGGEEGLKKASKFYNSLKMIEDDATAKPLTVRLDSKSLFPHVKLGGAITFLEKIGEGQNRIAEAIQEAINKIAENRYFQSGIKDEAKYANLPKAFDRWL